MIALDSPLTHSTDTQARIDQIGINYATGRVLVRVTFAQTGEQRDYFVGSGPTDIDTIAGLVAAVPNFSGLRAALESFLVARVPTLAGTVS